MDITKITCSQAAKLLYFTENGTDKPTREIVFTLAAFGEVPVPEILVERYDWERMNSNFERQVQRDSQMRAAEGTP